jgi:hypothetical protein
MKAKSEVVRVARLCKLYLCPVISAPVKYLLFSSPTAPASSPHAPSLIDPEANYLFNRSCVVLALVFLRPLRHYTSSDFLFVEVPAERCRWLSFSRSLHPSLRKRRQPQSTARHGVDCGTFSIWQSILEDSSERRPSWLEPVSLTS